jgi:lysylphosphatidylglycerol synthetase-like protein (DUF2156 family)
MRNSTTKLRMSRAYWLVMLVVLVVSLLSYSFFSNMSLERILIALFIGILGFFFVFMYNNKPKSVNRWIFTFLGMCIIGFALWAIVMFFVNSTGIRMTIASTMGDGFFALASLILCWILGGFIGGLIGEKMQYRLPKIKIDAEKIDAESTASEFWKIQKRA